MWSRYRVAIASSDPDRGIFNPFSGEGDESKARQGRLSAIDLDDADGRGNKVQHIDIENWPKGKSLHPLGIGLLDEEENKNNALLAVVNYAQKSACIDLLRLSISSSSSSNNNSSDINKQKHISATYITTFEHPSITSPNAVVILSATQILFTNSFKFTPRKSKPLYLIEQIFAVPLGSLNLLTGNPSNGSVTAEKITGGIALANGLAISHDKRVLCIAGCQAHELYIYDIVGNIDAPFSGANFVYRNRIPVNYLPDNLHFVHPGTSSSSSSLQQAVDAHQDYTVLAAGHPSALKYLKCAASKGKYMSSPSRVVKVSIPKRPAPERSSRPSVSQALVELFAPTGPGVKTVFESNGDYYGTSSTGAAFSNNDNGSTSLLVCGLWEDGILRCDNVDV